MLGVCAKVLVVLVLVLVLCVFLWFLSSSFLVIIPFVVCPLLQVQT